MARFSLSSFFFTPHFQISGFRFRMPPISLHSFASCFIAFSVIEALFQF